MAGVLWCHAEREHSTELWDIMQRGDPIHPEQRIMKREIKHPGRLIKYQERRIVNIEGKGNHAALETDHAEMSSRYYSAGGGSHGG